MGVFLYIAMDRKIVVLIIFILAYGTINAQKLVKKSVVNPETVSINIDTSNCFELILGTSNTNEVWVEAQIDGEYSKDLLLKVINEGSSVNIGTGFQPSFIAPNDKLSAHKIISIALKISVPKEMNVSIKGAYTNVMVSGEYAKIHVVLEDGACQLLNIKGAASINTKSGAIDVFSNGARVKTKNSFGTTTGKIEAIGDDIFELTTITGNIHLNKTD